MFKRIGFLALLAATLTACGGGSGDGLSYSSPEVEVSGLEAGQSVRVILGADVETLTFNQDSRQAFSRTIASGNSYKLKLETTGGTVCSFVSNRQLTIDGLKTANSPHHVGCGADLVVPEDPTDPADPEDPTSRTLTVTMSHGTADSPVSAANSATVRVTLRSPSGLLAGEMITFATTRGGLTQTEAVTNGSGVATVTLTAGDVKGAGTLTVSHSYSEGGENKTVTSETHFATEGDEGPGAEPVPTEYKLELTIAGGNKVTPTESRTVSAQITTTGSGSVADIPVRFSSDFGVLSRASALTDANGLATVTLSDGAEAGAGWLTATADVSSGTLSARVGIEAEGGSSGQQAGTSDYSLAVVSITNATGTVSADNPITEAYPATVVVKLMHSGAGEVANKLVRVATTLGVLDGAAVNEGDTSATLLTDANGEVSFELRPSGASGGGLITAEIQMGNGVEASPRPFVIHLATVGDAFLEPLRLRDPLTNDERRDVPADGWLRVEAEVSGVDVANKVVIFTLNGSDGVGALDPVSATALTDGSGVATIKLLPGSSAGAAIVTATVRTGWEGEEQSSSQSIAFSSPGQGVSSEPEEVDVALELQRNGAVVAQVNEGQTVLLKAALTSSGLPWTGEAYVEFASRCMAAGQATINGTDSPAPVAAWSGEAQAAYIPTVGCTSDVISARTVIGGDTVLDTQDLEVVPSLGSSIEFVGASPNVLGLKGSAQAGAKETSTLTFLVKNANGSPVAAGTRVAFAVTGSMGGFSITSDTVVPTNSEGFVVVTVKSGSVPGVAGVKASLEDNPEIFTTGHLSIHSGVVTQDRFVLAVSDINVAAWNHQGVEVEVSARAADRFGNWVPDGTRINFATELGDIEGSCETENGGCSVRWTSQGAQYFHVDKGRATRDCEDDPEKNYKQGTIGARCGLSDIEGRSTIIAWTIGEESFADSNGNNLFDLAEEDSREALPEVFIDFNETGFREDDTNIIEQSIDYNQNNAYDGPAATFRGVGCSVEAEGLGHCDDLVHVRRSALIVLSTDAVQGTVSSNTISATTGGSFTATIRDMHGNAAAVGSTITVTTLNTGGTVLGPSSCEVPATAGPFSCEFKVAVNSALGYSEIEQDIVVTFQSSTGAPPVTEYITPQ